MRFTTPVVALSFSMVFGTATLAHSNAGLTAR